MVSIYLGITEKSLIVTMRERTARGHLASPDCQGWTGPGRWRFERREERGQVNQEGNYRRGGQGTGQEWSQKPRVCGLSGLYTGKEKPGGGEAKPSPGLERF